MTSPPLSARLSYARRPLQTIYSVFWIVYMDRKEWRRNILRLVVEQADLCRLNNLSNDETPTVTPLLRVHKLENCSKSLSEQALNTTHQHPGCTRRVGALPRSVELLPETWRRLPSRGNAPPWHGDGSRRVEMLPRSMELLPMA